MSAYPHTDKVSPAAAALEAALAFAAMDVSPSPAKRSGFDHTAFAQDFVRAYAGELNLAFLRQAAAIAR
jgi:hypothetical protein